MEEISAGCAGCAGFHLQSRDSWRKAQWENVNMTYDADAQASSGFRGDEFVSRARSSDRSAILLNCEATSPLEKGRRFGVLLVKLPS